MRKTLSTVALALGLALVGMPAAMAEQSAPPDWTAPAPPAAPACGVTTPSNPAVATFPEPICLDDVARTYVAWLYDYIVALEVNANQWADFYEGYIQTQNTAIHFQRQRISHQRHVISHQRRELRHLRAQLAAKG